MHVLTVAVVVEFFISNHILSVGYVAFYTTFVVLVQPKESRQQFCCCSEVVEEQVEQASYKKKLSSGHTGQENPLTIFKYSNDKFYSIQYIIVVD